MELNIRMGMGMRDIVERHYRAMSRVCHSANSGVELMPLCRLAAVETPGSRHGSQRAPIDSNA